MTRFGIALATVSLAFAATTVLADPPNIRKYTPGDLYIGSGDPKTPLARGDNPISGADVLINCTHPSCQVVVSLVNGYCSNAIPNLASLAFKIYVDVNRLVLAQWVNATAASARCGSSIWVGNFELHSGSHTVSLDTLIPWDTSKYPATQGAWQVSYQVGIPNP